MDHRAPPRRHLWLVFAGGMIGALLRTAIATWFPAPVASYPWATFAANVTGTFLLATVLSGLAELRQLDRTVRLLVGTGVLGAFTTYSTLAVELNDLLGEGVVGLAVLYAAASLGAGILAGFAGILAGGAWARHGRRGSSGGGA